MAVSTQQSSPNLIQSTDYNIRGLYLYSSYIGGNLDLTNYLVELNIFEDIFNNTISGNVVLSDAIGIINLMGLNGTEFLKVVLSKTSDDIPINRTFRVFSVSERKIDINNNNESYVVNFCSEEFLLSEQYRICKPYTGQTISNIVTDILVNFLQTTNNNNPKQLFIDQTYGQYDFILPNKKIFETVNWLSTYARPASGNPGADMLFYENLWGFNFKSIQNLFTEGAKFSYYFNPKNVGNTVSKKMDDRMNNILEFQILKGIDTLKAISDGTFSNRLLSVDPLLRKKYTTDFNYNDYNQKSKHLNTFPLINNYKNRFNATLFDSPPTSTLGFQAGNLRLAASNSNQFNNPYIKQIPGSVAHDIFIETYVPNRVAQISIDNYHKIKITVPGNPQVTTGMVLNINAFGISDFSNSKSSRNLDPYYSGNYLVSAVRHVISMANNNRAYITVIELIKESNIGSVPPVNVNDPSQQQIVSGSQS